MNKGLMITVIVVLVLILTAGFLFWQTSQPVSVPAVNNNSSTTAGTDDNSNLPPAPFETASTSTIPSL